MKKIAQICYAGTFCMMTMIRQPRVFLLTKNAAGFVIDNFNPFSLSN